MLEEKEGGVMNIDRMSLKQTALIILLVLFAAAACLGLSSQKAYADRSDTGSDGIYVLMNIPYADFYKAELGTGAAPVDAVTSATKNKPRTGTLAGGSYHKNTDGTDISGVIYPVKVPNKEMLNKYKEITDSNSVSITVTNRGQESTTKYIGSDALFESADYSYYVLNEKPARYKKLTVAEDGSFSFGAVSGRAAIVEGITADIEYESHHNNDVEISLEGITGFDNNEAVVSGIVVTGDDGTKEGLRHIAEIWRKTYIGWADASKWYGKTITNIRFITKDAVTDYPVEIKIKSNLGEISAAFTDLKTITLAGLPEDIQNPKATVQTIVDRGETPTVIANKVDVKGGVITTTDAATATTEYAIRVISDNYADISLNTTSPEDSSSGSSTPASSATDQAKSALNAAITDAKSISANGYTPESYKALADAIAAAEKVAADPNATAAQMKAATDAIAAAKAGLVQAAADDSEYTVTSEAADAAAGTAALTNPKDVAKYNIPKTVVLADGKTYKVTAIGAGAFTGKQTKKVIVGANVQTIEQGAFAESGVTKLIVKTKKLTRTSVAGSLTGSSVKVVKVKVGKSKVNKKFVKKYKKIFTAENAGRKVKVK